MDSKVKFIGHALHPMLVNMPLALLPTSVGFDVMRLSTQREKWGDMSQTVAGLGIIGGVTAAVPGWIDWFGIPNGTRAKTIGLVHGIGNVAVLGLFGASYLMRRNDPQNPKTLPIALAATGVGLALVTAWLGGELVDRLGVGVDEGAHLNAPNSLTHESASEEEQHFQSMPGD